MKANSKTIQNTGKEHTLTKTNKENMKGNGDTVKSTVREDLYSKIIAAMREISPTIKSRAEENLIQIR